MSASGRAKKIVMDLGRKMLKKLEKFVPPSRAFDALPPEMASMLNHARRRIISIVLARGLLAVLAAALISVLLIMAVDAMTMMFTAGPRWVMWEIGRASCRERV